MMKKIVILLVCTIFSFSVFPTQGNSSERTLRDDYKQLEGKRKRIEKERKTYETELRRLSSKRYGLSLAVNKCVAQNNAVGWDSNLEEAKTKKEKSERQRLDLVELRKKLDFIWRAFFADNRERDNSTVLDSYLALKSIMADGIVSELYLLVPGGSRADLPKLVAIPRSDVSKFISAGDEIAVRCGSDDHQASVWRVDEDAGLVFLLDPFYEFWTPEQAPCTPSFRHISYKYGRKLVSIKLDELRPMVLAIFTLRDARQD